MSPRAEQVRRLWRSRPRSRFLRLSLLVLGLFVLASWWMVVEPAELHPGRRLENLRRFLARDALPQPLREGATGAQALLEWIRGQLAGGALEALAATLWISVAAIVLAAGVGLLLAPLGAGALVGCEPFDLRGDGGRPCRGPRAWTARATRLVCVLLRAVPEYVWAFLLLALLPPGAWPAVLALALHNAGILGRLGADTVDNLERAPLRSLRMLGARRRDLYLFGVLPMALPRFLLFFFYRFETCVREATVLGMLGIASLGYSIAEARARQRYDEMLLLVALGAGIVLLADLVSLLARRTVRRAP